MYRGLLFYIEEQQIPGVLMCHGWTGRPCQYVLKGISESSNETKYAAKAGSYVVER